MHIVESGQITPNILYKVIGEKSVVYNGIEYSTGDIFKGVDGVNEFYFIGDGTELVTELTEIKSGALLFKQTYDGILFPAETTVLSGMAIQFKLTDAERIVNEATQLKGMSILFKDYPFYTHFINETRFSFNPN